MPQDRLRSVVYRSFVICDDPKGVVECETIRKSKNDSKLLEDKTKNQRTNSNTSTSYEEGRKDKVCNESTEELQNQSSFHIMEVSRGAEKLNEVVDLWSNKPSLDNHSKHIGKDLLRGALDLQESLVMFGKLQEASNYIAKLKKRHKEKSVGGSVDVGTKFTDADPFGDDNKPMEFQKPRISADRASRDCYDELREVIRESFARQNLLPKVSVKEKDHLDRKKSEVCMDFPSSSSSQSSLIYSHSSNCSQSSVQHEKPDGPNLIAKLIGLEEVPSKAVNYITLKQMEKEKLSNRRSYLLDIDLPRPKKLPFMVQKVVRERKTLEEMIETMQFKGLVERKFIDEFNNGKYYFDVPFSRTSLAVEGSPIVIMRPLHVPDLRAKRLHQNRRINEEKHIKRQMPQNVREPFPHSALEVPRGKLKFTGTKEKLIAGRRPKKLNKDKEDKHSEKFPVIPIKKTLNTHDRLSTMKITNSNPLVPRMQKKEAVVRKIEDKPKVATNIKQAEKRATKSEGDTIIQDPSKLATLKLSKAVSESNVIKSQITRGKVATTNKSMKATSLKSTIPKKNSGKTKANSKPSSALVEDRQSEDDLPINIESNIHESSMKSTASEQFTEQVMNASYISLSDSSEKVESFPCDSSETISKDVFYVDGTKGCNSITNTRYLLLSSASFLNHVEEVLDTGTCNPTLMQTLYLADIEVLDNSLLLDCAKEILERKSLRYKRTIDPFSQNLLRKAKCHLSIEELVGQISDGIEDLRNYSKSCGDIVHVDSIYPMLERDVWCNEEVTGGWDLGWRNGYNREAVNQVLHDIEKLFFSEFIAGVVRDTPENVVSVQNMII